MDSDPFSAGFSAESNTEKKRILGLETEHAVFFQPADEAAAAPPFEVLQQVLFDCLLEGRKSAVSGGLKGGYFLENGGLVHLEVYFRRQEDTPILETATPECRSPQDVAAYSRAFDEILEETARRSEEPLSTLGYRGRLAFGKNNLDIHGTGFGCHENYLFYSRTTRLQKALYVVALLAVFLCLLPPFLLILACVVPLVVAAAFGFLVAKIIPPLLHGLLSLYRWVIRVNPGKIVTRVRTLYWVAVNMIFFPAIAVYSFALRHLAYRPVLQELTSFLVSRQILVGTGSLNFRRGVYELSQRAELTRSIGEIVLFGKHKTIFDLKGFLYSPLEFFREHKKLTITVGDSSLSDFPNVLRMGTTLLLLEMIEAGESFADLRLRRPVRALKQVSLEGPWKELVLRSGAHKTAFALHREFLERAKAFHASRPETRYGRKKILRLWEETLDRLAEGPSHATDRVDWVAKKAILDRAILSTTNWKTFFQWGRLFSAVSIKRAARARSVDDLLRSPRFWTRARLHLLVPTKPVTPEHFEELRDLYFQVRKIDFRFHELGGGTGYQRQMEASGMIQRLTREEDVARAVTEAPPDTRARIRSYYIRRSREPQLLRVNWNEIELLSPVRLIPTPDPFFYRLPTD